MQQIQLVDQPLLFKKIDRAVDGDEVNTGIDFLRSLEDLIHVQMLLGVVHHLQDDAALAGHADAAGSHRLLNLTGCFGGIEALAGGNPMGRRCSHLSPSASLAQV